MANYSKLISDIQAEKVPSTGRKKSIALPGGGRSGLWTVELSNTGREVRFEVVQGARGRSTLSQWGLQYGDGKRYATAEDAWTALKINLMRDIANGTFEKFINNL